MTQSQSLKVSIHPVAMMNRNGRPEISVGVSVDNAPMVVEVVDPKLKEHCTLIDQVYGEDAATTMEEVVTPFSLSVAR